MAELVVAEVILKAEESLTSETARNKIPETRIQDIREKLSGAGFEIAATGPYSLSIIGSPALFEKVFATQLRVISTSGSTAATKTFYQAQQPAKIPEDWIPFVSAINFPTPPQLFP